MKTIGKKHSNTVNLCAFLVQSHFGKLNAINYSSEMKKHNIDEIVEIIIKNTKLLVQKKSRKL